MESSLTPVSVRIGDTLSVSTENWRIACCGKNLHIYCQKWSKIEYRKQFFHLSTLTSCPKVPFSGGLWNAAFVVNSIYPATSQEVCSPVLLQLKPGSPHSTFYFGPFKERLFSSEIDSKVEEGIKILWAFSYYFLPVYKTSSFFVIHALCMCQLLYAKAFQHIFERLNNFDFWTREILSSLWANPSNSPLY